MPSIDLDTGSNPGSTPSSSSFSSLLGEKTPPSGNPIPVLNVDDSEETESDLDSQARENRNMPVYKTFITEVYTHNSLYTTLASLERFRRSTPVTSPTSEQLILLDPCQKEELICLNMPDQGSSSPFTYMGVGAMSDLLIAEDDVAFLRNSAPIDCGFLLENEKLPDRLHQILDKMPPKADVPRTLVNKKAMRRWLKKVGGDPGGQGSENLVNQPANSTTERRKKQKLDVLGDAQSKQNATNEEQPAKATITAPQFQENTNPSTIVKQAGAHASSGVHGPSSSLSPLGDKWWTLFNNFEGPEGGEVNSIFDHRFNVEQVVAREFNKKEDRTRVNKVGMRNVGKHLMTMGMQTAFFGYCFDNILNSMEKELKDRSLKIQELTEKLKVAESSTQTIASLEQSLLDTKTKLTVAENEKKVTEVELKLKKDLDDAVAKKNKSIQDLSTTIEQKKQLEEDNTKLEADLEALQKEIAI
ncbi:hypothetical protein SESBI_00263 [Sesbania bispinosa]|nr:hypothetical protein SESBI_00263 [Sesbania bispinosa]